MVAVNDNRRAALEFMLENGVFDFDHATGRVYRMKSLRGPTPKPTAPRSADEKFSSNGYRRVAFRFGGLWLSIQAHRLVVSIDEGRVIEDDEVVDHLNSIRTDNRRENLALVTFGENHDRAVACRRLKTSSYPEAAAKAARIRDAAIRGRSLEAIAAAFDVTLETVVLTIKDVIAPALTLDEVF